MEVINWAEYKVRCTDKKGFTLTHYSKLFNAAHCRVNIEDLDFQLGYDDRYSTEEWNNQVNQFKKAHLENFVEITAEVAEEIKNTLSAYEAELATVKAYLATGLSGFEYNGAIAKKAHLEMMVAKYAKMVELLPTFAVDEDEKTFNVYSFSELSESAKQTAIDAYRNDENYPYDFWFEHSKEDFHAILSLLGFSNIESGFSGFCSQGDGANFTGSYTYKKGALKALLAYAPNDKELYNIAKMMQNIQSKYFYKLECELSKTSRYEHAYTVSFDFTVWNAHGTDEVSMSRGDEETLKNCFIDLMNWYYKVLESEYDYLTSNECIIENIEANEYQYLECGKQYF